MGSAGLRGCFSASLIFGAFGTKEGFALVMGLELAAVEVESEHAASIRLKRKIVYLMLRPYALEGFQPSEVSWSFLY